MVTNTTAATLQQIRKKPWIGEDKQSLLDKRKAAKGKDQAKYANLNKHINKKCRLAKEKVINDKCEEITQLNFSKTKQRASINK